MLEHFPHPVFPQDFSQEKSSEKPFTGFSRAGNTYGISGTR